MRKPLFTAEACDGEPAAHPCWVVYPDGKKVLHLWSEWDPTFTRENVKVIPLAGRAVAGAHADAGSTRRPRLVSAATGRLKLRAALYARFSSESQRDASIADQMRLCRLHAEQQGWRIVEEYSDSAVSGASLIRPGIQALIADAGRRRFDVILTESLDRLSRDQEDVAGLYKRVRFAGAKIITLSEGEISELHIGLKGTMGALYLKDLADKTRRGLRGRIEAGKSGGGLTYGYEVVKRFTEAGEPIRGDRTINATEAEVVRHIFREYAAGKSSRAIAWALNRDGIPGPFGNAWGPSTIHGNPKRGNGILNNELYVGRLVWNRQRFIKDPETGKRVSRLNPEGEWVTQKVPELRIVDDELWQRVKERQRALAYTPKDKTHPNPLLDRRRPKHLLAGLAKCGVCGGGYTLISEHLLGCATARNKGKCANRLNIRRDALEASVLSGLRTHLMHPDLFREFCTEFTAEINRLRIEERASQAACLGSIGSWIGLWMRSARVSIPSK